MTPEQAAELRKEFDPKQIGKLPKPTKATNEKGRCQECGGWHGLPAVHLDYVGHAACTDRLLKVDPEWTWRPMARGPQGEPLLVNGGLWIELTIAGVTRPGFGDESNGKGMKEIIGDAIRNAAMRFGVALDLWSKEDLWARQNESEGSGAAGEPVGGTPDKAGAAEKGTPREAAPARNSNGKFITRGDDGKSGQLGYLWTVANKSGVPTERVREIVTEICGPVESTKEILQKDFDAVIHQIQMDGVPFG